VLQVLTRTSVMGIAHADAPGAPEPPHDARWEEAWRVTEAIIARMHASAAWPAFYGLFVVAVAIHAPLGLRAIADEWLSWRGQFVDALLAGFALVLLGGGVYAIRALAA
jgi:succinate dehydrogenase hydrophobic anchor subunit